MRARSISAAFSKAVSSRFAAAMAHTTVVPLGRTSPPVSTSSVRKRLRPNPPLASKRSASSTVLRTNEGFSSSRSHRVRSAVTSDSDKPCL